MAQAILFMYDPITERTSTDVFKTPEFENPVRSAEHLKASCKDDFPDAIWSIGSDQEARSLIADLRVREMFGREQA